MYEIVTPKYAQTGQYFTTINPRNGQVMQAEWMRVDFIPTGQKVSGMEEAKKLVGGFPVLRNA